MAAGAATAANAPAAVPAAAPAAGAAGPAAGAAGLATASAADPDAGAAAGLEAAAAAPAADSAAAPAAVPGAEMFQAWQQFVGAVLAADQQFRRAAGAPAAAPTETPAAAPQRHTRTCTCMHMPACTRVPAHARTRARRTCTHTRTRTCTGHAHAGTRALPVRRCSHAALADAALLCAAMSTIYLMHMLGTRICAWTKRIGNAYRQDVCIHTHAPRLYVSIDVCDVSCLQTRACDVCDVSWLRDHARVRAKSGVPRSVAERAQFKEEHDAAHDRERRIRAAQESAA
mgnify:CR=1 FL=1